MDSGSGTQERELASLAAQQQRWVRFVARRVPGDVDAEDVVQRALLRAVDHIGSLRDPARLTAWFHRILRRVVADTLLSHARDPVAVPDEDLAASSDAHPPVPDELAIDAACACITDVLSTLRPEYATVLRRVVLDEVSLRDAAAQLAITPANAAVRLHRARGVLKRHLVKRCGVHTLRACLDCTCAIDGRCGGRTEET